MNVSGSVISCPACDCECRPWVTREIRRYARCRGCGTAHITNPPAQHELDRLYDETVFTLPGNSAYYDDDRTNLIAAHERRRWVERSITRGALLEIGCGYGHFLSVLDREKWDARGVDVSAHVIHQARQRFGVRCEARPIDQLPRQWHGVFDAVAMWDVIEHLPRPAAALRRAAAMLKQGGHLFLSTPDISSPVARLLGGRWHYIDPMQHLTLFSRGAIDRLCRLAGLRVVRRRTFGRSYTVDYLIYRLGYCFPAPGLRTAAAALRKCLGPARNLSLAIRLGDIAAIEAVKE